MRCIIILGGEFCPPVAFRRAPGDFIIAADKGYEYAGRMGLTPDLFVGDRDSFTAPLPEDLEKIILASRKDDTDALSAAKEGVRRGYKEFLLLCAMGGRLDHLLGNLAVMAYLLEQGASCGMESENQHIWMLEGPAKLSVPGDADYISLLSYSDRCTGVTTHNMSYPLEDATLTGSFPLGVSNEVLERGLPVAVEFRSGKLLVTAFYAQK